MDQEKGSLSGKKLLILGGTDYHTELVRTAKDMGIETYVTDYVKAEASPAKQIADHAWELSVTEYDAIAERCRKEAIDGVLNMYYNPCQIPYQKICERLGLPCFGTEEQFAIFTDKSRFTKTCRKFGLDVIPEYQEEDFLTDHPGVIYPVYVKPSDANASKGQTVCRSYAETAEAIALAKRNSSSGRAVIQRYMEHGADLQFTFLMIDGELHWQNCATLFSTKGAGGLTSSIACAYMPSRYGDMVPQEVIEKIRTMTAALGLKNGPVFMQGFLENGRVYFYDPALRFPAGYTENYIKYYHGFDFFEGLIRFALTGHMPAYLKQADKVRHLNGRVYILLWVFLRRGKIKEIRGMDWVKKNMLAEYAIVYHKEGDLIEDWGDFRQCFCALSGEFGSQEDAEAGIAELFRRLQILDENGRDMKTAVFDPARIRE